MSNNKILYTTSPRLYFLIRFSLAILLPPIVLSLLLPISLSEFNFSYAFVLVFLFLVILFGIIELLQMDSLQITNKHVTLNQGFLHKKIFMDISDIVHIYYNDNEISSSIGTGSVGFNNRKFYLYTNYRTTIILNDNEKWTINTLMPHDYRNFMLFYDQIKSGTNNLTCKKLSPREYWNDNQDGLKSFLLDGMLAAGVCLVYILML